MRRSLGMVCVLVAAVGCSASHDKPSGPAGSPVDGPADTHCQGDGGAMIVQPVSLADCYVRTDAGVPDGGVSGSDYGPTMYNTEGNDDDCKYHVKWTVSPVYENYDVSFVVTATKRTDGSPLTGANPLAEVYLSDTHPAPNSPQTARESPSGTYTIGPVRFDASGRWTVRFHFYENCYDYLDTSPHGHAAFYLDVP